jgi:hypothetical protein
MPGEFKNQEQPEETPKQTEPILETQELETQENKEEIYDTETLFDFLSQRYEVPNYDATKKQLLEYGMESKDIDAVLELMTCIIGIDANVENLKGIRLEFNAAKNTKLLAGYSPASENKEEKYVVYVDGSADEVIRRCGDGALTKQEVFLKTAVHEIRHRIQYTAGFKMFTDENVLGGDEELKKYADYVKTLQDKKIKFYKEKGETDKFIGDRINKFEFDSELIENFAIEQIRMGITLDDLIKLITLQPK